MLHGQCQNCTSKLDRFKPYLGQGPSRSGRTLPGSEKVRLGRRR